MKSPDYYFTTYTENKKTNNSQEQKQKSDEAFGVIIETIEWIDATLEVLEKEKKQSNNLFEISRIKSSIRGYVKTIIERIDLVEEKYLEVIYNYGDFDLARFIEREKTLQKQDILWRKFGSLPNVKKEIDKIKTIAVEEDELNGAKNNIIGKQEFLTETNAQQCTNYAHYGVMNLGFDYRSNLIARIKSVTSEQIMECANKYFVEKSVIAVLRP